MDHDSLLPGDSKQLRNGLSPAAWLGKLLLKSQVDQEPHGCADAAWTAAVPPAWLHLSARSPGRPCEQAWPCRPADTSCVSFVSTGMYTEGPTVPVQPEPSRLCNIMLNLKMSLLLSSLPCPRRVRSQGQTSCVDGMKDWHHQMTTDAWIKALRPDLCGEVIRKHPGSSRAVDARYIMKAPCDSHLGAGGL